MSQPLEYEQISYNSPDGSQWGRTSQDPIAVYGSTPVAQRASANQRVLTVSAATGVLVTHLTLSQQGYQAAVTSGAISSTVISVSGCPQLSTADVIVVNKQGADAGHGYGGARVSAAPTATYAHIVLHQINCSAGDLNASPDAITIAAVRGFVNSVTLSPSVVVANNTSEQQFTVTGLAPGMTVPVVKPTEQRGLGIAGTRVVSNNILGITFVNSGMSAITPTASEVYRYAGLAGIASTVNILTAGIFTSSLQVSGVSNDAVTAQAIAVTGIRASDRFLGTGQHHYNDVAGITLISARVSAANVVALAFLNSLSSLSAPSKLTPTVNDTYTLPMLRINNEAPMTKFEVSLSPSAVGVSASTEQSFTVTGLVNPSVVYVTKPSFTSGIGIVNCRVSAADTLGITFCNPTAASITPPTETYIVAAVGPVLGRGHYLEHIVSPLAVKGVALTNELRDALAGLGLIQGN